MKFGMTQISGGILFNNLLEYAVNNLELRDFVIISLLATTGLRPSKIAGRKRNNVHLNRHCIHVHVKGGWIKETPVSASMAAVLNDYLTTTMTYTHTIKSQTTKEAKSPLDF
jgi:integrase